MRRPSASTAALILGLLLASGCGSGREASPTAALREAEQHLAEERYAVAYDYVLAAMRISPSSPEVFDASLAFVREAAATNDDVALDLASDVYFRCGTLIPFQPVERIPEARAAYEGSAEVFDTGDTTGPAAADPLAGVTARLEQIDVEGLPSAAASLVVQDLRSELHGLAVSAASSPPASPNFWEDWSAVEHKLDELELRVLGSVWDADREKRDRWTNVAEGLVREYQSASTEQYSALGEKMADHIQDGYRLRTEVVPFAESGLKEAAVARATLDQGLERLERLREWIYNRHALEMIVFLESSEENGPMEKLQRLAVYDDRRLMPYIFERYTESWKRWFEELEDTQQKVEATKLRALRGVTE